MQSPYMHQMKASALDILEPDSSDSTTDHWDVCSRLHEWETDINLESTAINQTCIYLH